MSLTIDVKTLEQKIMSSIPILKSMGVRIQKVEDHHCVVSVPLAVNHNHKNTAFGGSLYAACTAACYTLIYAMQERDKILNRDLVITQGRMTYAKPTTKDFVVVTEMDPLTWSQFTLALSHKKPQRLKMTCFVRHEESGENLCQFEGLFALLPA